MKEKREWTAESLLKSFLKLSINEQKKEIKANMKKDFLKNEFLQLKVEQ